MSKSQIDQKARPPATPRGAAVAGIIFGVLPAASFARVLITNLSAVFVIRMAAVFMISSATALMRTRVMPIWLALATYVVALILLLIVNVSLWVSLLFPMWVLVVSIVMLIRKYLPQQEAAETLTT